MRAKHQLVAAESWQMVGAEFAESWIRLTGYGVSPTEIHDSANGRVRAKVEAGFARSDQRGQADRRAHRQTRPRSRATPGIPNPHAITIAPHRARPRSTHQHPANCDGLQVPANKPTSATNRSGQPQPSADGQPHPNPRADHQTQPPNPSDHPTQPPPPGEPPSPAPHPSEPTSPATARE